MSTGFNLTGRVNLQGPFGLKPIVDRVRKSLGNIKANIDIGIDKSALGNLKALSSHLSDVESKLKSVNSLSASTRGNLSGLGDSFNKAGKSAQNQARSQSDLNVMMAKTRKGAAQAASEMEEFGRVSGLAIRRFAGFTIATGAIFGFINSVQSGVKEAINFEREVIRIAQSASVSVTSLKSLTDKVTELSVAYGVNSTELLQSSRILVQAGLSINDTRKALETLAKTSLAPSFDSMGQSAEAVISVMSQFKLEAKDLESVFSSINTVSNKFAVEASDIIGAISRTGGVFAAAAGSDRDAKQSIREFIALFTSIRATTRESAESIATGLRTIFARLQRPTTIANLKELGIELSDLEGKFVGPYEAVRRLNEGLSHLDTRDIRFAKITEELGGYRQIGKVIPLVKEFQRVSEEALRVGEQGGSSLTEDAITAQQSLAVQLTRTKEQFLALIREISNTDTFKLLAKGAILFADSLINITSALKPVIPLLAAYASFKGVQSAIEFTKGFRRGISSGGGASGLGERVAGGQSKSLDTSITTGNTQAINQNTQSQNVQTNASNAIITALSNNSNAINGLTSNITALIQALRVIKLPTLTSTNGPRKKGFSGGGGVRRFSRGGVARFAKGGAPFASSPNLKVKRGNFTVGQNTSNIKSKKFDVPNRFGAVFLTDSTGKAVSGIQKETTGKVSLKDILPDIYNHKDPKKKVNLTKEFGFGEKDKDFFYNLSSRSLSHNTSLKLKKNIRTAVRRGIRGSAELVRSELGIGGVPGKVDNQLLKTTNIDQTVGNIFEGTLLSAGAPYDGRTASNETFDFPFGIGKLSEKFDIPNGIPTDAKSSFTKGALDSVNKKAINFIKKKLSKDIVFKNLDSRSDKTDYSKSEVAQFLNLKPSSNPSNSDLIKRAQRLGIDISEIKPGGNRPSTFSIAHIKKARGGDTFGIPALTEPGELVFGPKAAQQAGVENLMHFNKTGDPSVLRSFDSRDVSVVPGIGRGDSFRTDLPEGSFVVRRDSSENLDGNFGKTRRKYKTGGTVSRFAKGGSTGRLASEFYTLGGSPKVINPEKIRIVEFQLKELGGNTVQVRKAMNKYQKVLELGGSELKALQIAQKNLSQSMRDQTNTVRKRGIGNFGSKLSNGLNNTLNSPAFGIGVSLAAPLIQNSIGDKTPGASATGSGITGALTGGFVGFQVGGPYGAAVGALIGGITSATSAYVESAERISRANLDSALDNFSRKLQEYEIERSPKTEKELEETARNLTKSALSSQDFVTQTKHSITDFIIDLSSIGQSLQGNFAFADTMKKNSEGLAAVIDTQGIFTTSIAAIKSIPSIFSGDGSNSDVDTLFEDTQNRVAKEIIESQRGASENLLRAIRQKIESGVTKEEDILKGLGDRKDVLRTLGSQNFDVNKAFALGDREGRIQAQEFAGKDILSDEIKRGKENIARLNIENGISLTARAIDLLGARIENLGKVAIIASSAGEHFRVQLNSILGGFDSIQEIKTKDIKGPLEFIDNKELGNRAARLSSFTGGSSIAQELSKQIADTKLIRQNGVNLLASAARNADLKGTNPIIDAQKLINQEEFAGLDQNSRNILQSTVEQFFKGKQGDRGALKDPVNLINNGAKEIVNTFDSINKDFLDSEQSMQESFDNIINEYGKFSVEIAKKTKEISDIKVQISSTKIENRNRIKELTNQDLTINDVLKDLNSTIRNRLADGGIKGPTSPQEVGKRIFDLQVERSQLEQKRLTATGNDQFALIDQINQNTKQGQNLEEALKRGANIASEVAAVERKILESRQKRENIDSFVGVIRKAMNPANVQEQVQLQKGVIGAAAILNGQKNIKADEFDAGNALLKEMGELFLNKNGQAQLQDIIAEQNFKAMEANPATQELGKMLKELRNKSKNDEAVALQKIKDLQSMQEDVLRAQKEILMQEKGAIIKGQGTIAMQQLEALKTLPKRIADELRNLNNENGVNVGGGGNKQAVVPVVPPEGNILRNRNNVMTEEQWNEMRREQEERRKRAGFASGGIVGGIYRGKGIDSELINAQPGEFVVNRDATKRNMGLLSAINSGRINRFNNGGIVGNVTGSTTQDKGSNFALIKFSDSANKLANALGGLSNLAQVSIRLSDTIKRLENIHIPEKIQIESAPIKVEVVINGHEAFSKMEPSISKLITDKINRSIRDSINGITGETKENFG